MPIGSGNGGQLALFMWELVMITRDPAGIVPDIVRTIAVHPLVVVPSSIRYTDRSRSTVTETHGGATITKAGRGLRQLSIAGTFGVVSRGLGLYIGTGDLRFKRFYHEIVRLSDAINKEQVDAEKDLFRSPFLNLSLLPYDPDNSTFAINYYDFWHDVSFEASVESFEFTKNAREASATGLTKYTLQAKEIGPIITGGLGTTLINGLFDGLTAWDSINEIIKSYTLTAITSSLVDAGGIVVGQFVDTMSAFKAQVDGATGLLNGFSDPTASVTATTDGAFDFDSSTDPESSRETNAAADYGSGSATGLSAHLDAATTMRETGTELLESLRLAAPAEPIDTEGGSVDWGSLTGEGSIPGLDAIDNQEALSSVIDAAAFQQAVGALYGMSREEYAAFLASTGRSGRDPALLGTTEHVVTDYDTATGIEQTYGVPWSTILRLNDLLPEEALLSGTRLLVPRQRAGGAGQSSQIEGLPVFGSHAGRKAWGADLYADLRVDATGAFLVARDTDVLEQGVDWLVAQFSGEILAFVNEAPPIVRNEAVQKRVAAILATDPRIASVDRVDATTAPDGTMSIGALVSAINGGTIQTGTR